MEDRGGEYTVVDDDMLHVGGGGTASMLTLGIWEGPPMELL